MHKFDIGVVIFFLIIISILFISKIKTKFNDNSIDDKIKKILTETSHNKDISEEKEKFTVSDAQDFHNYDKLRENVKRLSDNFNQDTITNPPNDDKVDYDKEKEKDEYSIGITYGKPKYVPEKKYDKSYITARDFGWDSPFPTVGCANSSIDNRFKSGPKKLLPFQMSCGYPNGLTAENYYKTHYMAQAAKLEDYAVRGSNYMEYSRFPHPTKSNIRLLSQNTKGLPPEQTVYKNIPSGSNYAFPNSPAMREPK